MGQYHRSEVLIEHVGDSSSLQGKVQRIREDYFKSHHLTNNLFDNPPADLRTNLITDMTGGTQLQTVYGLSSSGHQAIMANQYWQSSSTRSPPPDAFFEIVFRSPTNLEIFNLRLGGHLPPARKGQKAEVPNPEFDYVLEDAELQFGRDLRPPGIEQLPACRSYESVDQITGRELLWRSPRSRPAQAVRCVKIAIPKAQKTPLIVRSITARSGQSAVGGQVLPTTVPPPITRLITTTTTTTSELGETPRQFQARFDRWMDSLFAWALTVSLAFGSGALGGVLGCVVIRLTGAGLGSGVGSAPS